MGSLAGRTVFITGASRGIGKAIALRAAADGANVVITGKTVEPHDRLPGTIHSAAEEVEAAGGRALAVAMDVRSEEQVDAAVAAAVERFGGIDVLVNNASAISLTDTLATPVRRFDLMVSVNVRATFVVSRACAPHLIESENAHVLTLSPPLDLQSRWFAPHVAYTLSKYGMSLCVLGMAEEFRDRAVAFNALWPRTLIYTAAMALIPGQVKPEHCRRPEIVADAAHAIVTRDARACTGRFFIDDEVLREEGVSDLSPYRLGAASALRADLFVDHLPPEA